MVGYDMKVDSQGNHNWHSNHKHIPRTNIYQELFINAFDQIAQDAQKLGFEIVNATPGSALTQFPPVRLEDIANGK